MARTSDSVNAPFPTKPVRVLCCPRLDRRGASSRYRTFQYLPYLQQRGFEIDVVPLLSDRYLESRYADGRRSVAHSVPGYMRRWLRLRHGKKYDLLWIEKEAFPWIPHWLERWMTPGRIPLVFDYDDAEFHRYNMHRSCWVRSLLGQKIDGVMRRASMVIAGNAYIAEYARQAGAARVEWLPTVVDLDRYPIAPPPRNNVFTIGWIGTPITSRFLRLIAPALREICRDGNARLVTVGAGMIDLPGVRIESRPWSEETEIDDLRQFDVGIMPLDSAASTRGKCGLKLIQYMAGSRAVVGTPVGVNAEIIRPGVNGFQANDAGEWVWALKQLRANAELRARMGRAGRTIVEDRYCLSVAAPRLASLLREASGSKAKCADLADASCCIPPCKSVLLAG